MLKDNDKISIWQQNVNKSPTCQHDLLSGKLLTDMGISVVALQEPPVNFLNLTVASRNWTPAYPSTHLTSPDKTRSLTLISAALSSESWEQVTFPSGDVTIISIKTNSGKIFIINIYNDGNSNETISQLIEFHRDNNVINGTEAIRPHVIWVGDFNRHHPFWDDPNDTRLFTGEALDNAEYLIEAVAGAGLELALPGGTPTHIHNVTKKWTRLDQVFLSDHSSDLLIACDTQPDLRGINTDHLPIITELNLGAAQAEEITLQNFREVDWEEFRETLNSHLRSLGHPTPILNQQQMDENCNELTEIIQRTISDKVPVAKLCSKSKRWWTKELTQLRKAANKKGRSSFNLRAEPMHVIHKEHKEAVKLYEKTLKSTKKQHWRDWLEKAEDPDIWAVHKLISAPPADGGKSRIPALKHKVGGEDRVASNNGDKSTALAKCFFPPKPQQPNAQADDKYPRQCERPKKITKEQILRHLKRLKPYKAPGPDGIPNIVLTKCADLLIERLLPIFGAMLERNLQYGPWKTFTTVVLRKPGKPRYDVPKAYRPIALLNTMWKALTAIIAEHISYLSEKHQLLPPNHFGGRPGRTTTDAMHLLIIRVKAAWRKGKVAAALFLDVEGAFPNAVPEKLIGNLRKRGVPKKYANFVQSMLDSRETTLKFDGYISESLQIDNGIGQGDPLSMTLYQFYNADLLDIPSNANEAAIAYVDDALMLAVAVTFDEAHQTLADMMSREGGVSDWSSSHNSPLELSKLALIDFAHPNSKKPRTPLQLQSTEVKPTDHARYLGVIFDQHLNWKAQHAHAIEKGAKWTAQIRRVTRLSWGVTPKYARRLYISVALPRILYGADVWCQLTPSERRGFKARVSAKAVKILATTQRAGALAITGGLRTSPTDTLDALSSLLPAELTIVKICHRAFTRMAMLPADHPLHKHIKSNDARRIKRHRTPIHNLRELFDRDPRTIEKIPSTARDPEQHGKFPFTISIAEDRANSIEEAENATEDLLIYTDGSAIEGKVGAAAACYDREGLVRVTHFHLGPDTEHTVHEAELVGMLLGLHFADKANVKYKQIAIGVDSQAALMTLQSDLRSPGQHLAREILLIANRIQKRKGRRKLKLTFRWTAGHEGIEGNEKADEEAKKAAKGLTTDKPSLPSYLRRTLLTNPSAVSQQNFAALKKDWTNTWRNSTRGAKLLKLDKTTPSKGFLKRLSNPTLSRAASSLISQLAITHVPLNAYLKRFKKVDSARCPACGTDEESVEHFLLACPGYASERWMFKNEATKLSKTLKMETILGDPDLTIPLANFIDATHRFKPTTSR